MIKKQKQSKKKLSSSKDTPQGIWHLGVLMESMSDKITLLAGQYGDIKSNTDTIKGTLLEHNRILVAHARTLSEQSDVLAKHTRLLASHTKMIASVAMNITVVKEDVGFIKHGFKKKIDMEELAALERRVALLERKR